MSNKNNRLEFETVGGDYKSPTEVRLMQRNVMILEKRYKENL